MPCGSKKPKGKRKRPKKKRPLPGPIRYGVGRHPR